MAEKVALCDPENNSGQETQGSSWKMQQKILCCLGGVAAISVIIIIPLVMCLNHKTCEEQVNGYTCNEYNTSTQNDSIIENKKNISIGEIVSVNPRTDEDNRRQEELLSELMSMGCEPKELHFKVSDLLPKDSQLHDLNYEPQYVVLKKCLPEGSFCQQTNAECLPSAVQVKWIPLFVQSDETGFLTYHLEVPEDQSCECVMQSELRRFLNI